MPTKNSAPHVPVKLHVKHHDDMQVISSHIQDAIFTSSAFTHTPETQSFKMLGNRFCWEKFLNPENPIKARVHAGIHFDHVVSVKKQNIHQHHPEKLYNLMTISAGPSEIKLLFSNDASIHINVEKVSCKMADLHEPYPTQFLPNHTHLD